MVEGGLRHAAKISAVVSVAAMVLAACAQRADQIAPSSISPLLYRGLDCRQLAQEAQRVTDRAAVVSGAQNQNATNDAIATGVAIVVFWPAAFLVRGDGANAAELARLRGELEAIERVSIEKRCGIQFQRQAPPPAPPAPSERGG